MKQSLKERWAEISALIEKSRDLLDESYEYLPHVEDHLETLEAEREALIKPYQALYENALDDLYYGYGYKTWYNGTKDVEGAKEYFDSEDDAKFLWRLAFYMTAEGSWDNALDD